jgi:methylmalonyl-CoA mutase N-terminal domain/subunit
VLEGRQRERVAAARAARAQEPAATALAALDQAARGTEALMPRILAAVRARATLGEIADVFRRAWGLYQA